MFRVAETGRPNRFPNPKDVVVEEFALEIEEKPSAENSKVFDKLYNFCRI